MKKTVKTAQPKTLEVNQWPRLTVPAHLPPFSLLSRPIPYENAECCVVCDWKGHDGSWEQLLLNHTKDVFYLNSSRGAEEPVVLTTSEALHWYAEKRQLDCDFGSLGWPNLSDLLSRAVQEVRFAEEAIGKRPLKGGAE